MRYAETAIWENAGGQSVADSWASTSFSRTACGASTQPTRKPGANVLENEPEVDHAVRLVGAQRPDRLAVEAEQAVGVVLEHQHVGVAADLEDLAGGAPRDSVTPAGLWKLGIV